MEIIVILKVTITVSNSNNYNDPRRVNVNEPNAVLENHQGCSIFSLKSII